MKNEKYISTRKAFKKIVKNFSKKIDDKQELLGLEDKDNEEYDRIHEEE